MATSRFRVAAPSRFADKGDWAEDQVKKWLTARQTATPTFAFHRYPDAKAARGALSPQPADFLISEPRANGSQFTANLEVKETAEIHRLPKKRISQFGKLLLFALSGMPCFVLVYRSHHSDWALFNHHHLFSDLERKSFPFSDPGVLTFQTADEALKLVLAFKPAIGMTLFKKETNV